MATEGVRARIGELLRSAGRYTPVLALVAAIALIVSIAPSRLAPSGSVETDVVGAPAPGPNVPGATEDGRAGSTRGTAVNPRTSGGSARVVGPNLPGTTKDGAVSRVAGLDCSRNAVLKGRTCRPNWTGANGGRTHNGVDAKTVNIVHYVAAQNEQVQTALSVAGIPTEEDRIEIFDAWEKYMNAVFQTYNRRVKLIVYYGTSMAGDASGQQAEAVKVATELKAFAVLSPTANAAFYDELHRRRIPVFTNSQFAPELHEQRAPHFFGFTPDLRLTSSHVAEYVCKRLWSKNAVYAGSPVYRSSKRKLGVIYQDGASINLGKTIASQIASCGGKVAVIKGYSPDVSIAVQQSTSIVASMREQGVTSVICACDPIFPAYFTQQATNQGWFPEWIHNGLYGTDLTLFSRLYDQKQWDHSFGVSTLEYPPFSTSDPGYLAYKKGKPDGDNPRAVSTSQLFFWMVRYVFDAVEAAGPTLNDRTFAQALFSLPPIKIGRMATYSFGRNGPSPYSLVDDVMEVWWSSTRTGPDGKVGTFFYVRGGARYKLGQWPRTGPNVFVDDGSPQPARDPNQ